MKRRKLRCYVAYAEAGGIFNNRVLYSAAEGYRMELASCASCGEVFIVDRENPEIGERALSEVGAEVLCPACGVELRASLLPYPETFRASNGLMGSFVPPTRIPPEEESLIMDLWALEPTDWGC